MRPADEDLAEEREPAEGVGLPEFVGDPWGVLRRRWPWMLLVAVLLGGVAVAFLATRPVLYQASAQLLLSGQRVPEDFVRQLSNESMSEQLSAIVGEILSTASIEKVVEAQDYVERSGFEGSRADLLSRIREATLVEADEPKVARSRRSDSTLVFAIRFTAKDAELAADMANALVSRFTAAHADRQSRQARLTTGFLEREAKRARAELEEARNRISQFKEEHKDELPSALETKLARLTRLQQQRDSLATQLSSAEGRLVALREGDVGDRRTELLSRLESRLSEQLAIHTEEHPNVRALQAQVEKLRTELKGNPPDREHSSKRPEEFAVEQEIQRLRSQIASVEEEIASLDVTVSKIPELHEKLDALEQQEALLREKYVEASRKLREAELAESLQREQQGFNVSVLQKASPPERPKDSLLTFALAAIAGTLGAAAAVAVLLELADPVLLTTRQVELEAGLPTLGVVPRIR